MTADTLQTDRQLLEQLQQDPRYAYGIEEDKPSLLDQLLSSLGRWLEVHLDANISALRVVVYGCCVAVVVLLVWWLLRSGVLRRLFGGDHRAREVSVEEAEENIYGIDFDQEIARATAAGHYTRAARLLYLQTLKNLSDAARISWEPQKTPTQYTSEVTSEDFRQLTNLFLRIRYGGFEADAQLFATMQALKASVEKGGAA